MYRENMTKILRRSSFGDNVTKKLLINCLKNF